MPTADRFEDRLLAELRQIVAERPTPQSMRHRTPPPRTRLALAGVGAAAATAAVALVASGGDVTPSAYAVEPRPDGSVTVEIRSLADADGLESKLRAAGVPAVVDYQQGCVTRAPAAATGGSGGSLSRESDPGSHVGPSLSGPGPAPGADVTASKIAVDGDAATFTVDPGTIKPGEKLYITTSTGAINSIGMAIGSARPELPCPPSP